MLKYSRDLEPKLGYTNLGGVGCSSQPTTHWRYFILILILFHGLVQEKLKKSVVKTAGEKGVGRVTGKPLHFKGSIFHRVISGFMAQVKFH
jgi:hypothetical protein